MKAFRSERDTVSPVRVFTLSSEPPGAAAAFRPTTRSVGELATTAMRPARAARSGDLPYKVGELDHAGGLDAEERSPATRRSSKRPLNAVGNCWNTACEAPGAGERTRRRGARGWAARRRCARQAASRREGTRVPLGAPEGLRATRDLT